MQALRYPDPSPATRFGAGRRTPTTSRSKSAPPRRRPPRKRKLDAQAVEIDRLRAELAAGQSQA